MIRPSAPDRGQGRQDELEWTIVVDEDWTTRISGRDAVAVTHGCRFFVRELVDDARGSRPVAHGAPIVAAMRRRYGRTAHRWWGYCAEHLYGRWIEPDGPLAGRVVGWRLRPTPPAGAR